METFTEIIDGFGGPARFAEALGITASHAGVMKQRQSIPPEYWPTLIEAAKARHIEGVTAETLVALAADRASRRSPTDTPSKATAA
jgi:hypothetical protein